MSANVVHLSDVQTRPKIFTIWERHRHTSAHWLVECFAEFMGVFFYVYAGIGSQIAYIVGNILKIEGLGSVLQFGFAYAFGIVFALGICSSTSGGHFNPPISVAMVIFKGFPPLKAVRYIIAQILGAYVACLLIYTQWHDLIKESELALASVGMLESTLFTPSGPAGGFALSVTPGLNLGRVFLNEFVTDTFLAMVIWGSIDPTNILIPPQAAPFVIGTAYAVAVWGFGITGLAANPARDIGGRLAALTIWGTDAAGGRYAAIAALTAFPATFFGILLHEFFLTDYARVLPSAQREFMEVHHLHAHGPAGGHAGGGTSVSSNEKVDIEHKA
ncbi:putative aquaporin 2 [Gymnopus androsaceus JB14]|uniref:Aquaporin 2 n=1 Tax=Gymnopus androsaceus JB14 TaxID=1447944 RepID=A0A6A4IEN7_9AGAR|nr:putative aquaporin 2 [Gymnopus androsaceus JB14]